jgi:copper homeostasis protein
MASSILIEACIDDASTARAVVDAGAGRIELCGPGNGGTTPSADQIRACCTSVSVPVHVMIRPHDGHFVYSDDDLAMMVDSIAMARECGAHGVVFGPLTRSNRIADSELGLLVGAARGMHTVFHRAFDRVPDAHAALDTLMEYGVGSVLTCGNSTDALAGAPMLAALRERAAGRVNILAGGGVRAANVRDIVHRSGVAQVHARGTDPSIIAAISAALQH